MIENVVFMKLTDACRTTGLSNKFLRQGCKNGTIPHIMVGNRYYVNIPALLAQLDRESVQDREEE